MRLEPSVKTTLTPDSFICVYNPVREEYHILSGWWGGYAMGDSWRFSTAINSASKDGDIVNLLTVSKRPYKLNIETYELTSSVAYAVDLLKLQEKGFHLLSVNQFVEELENWKE